MSGPPPPYYAQNMPPPPPPYSPRSPFPPQVGGVPPAATYVPPSSSQYPHKDGLQDTLTSVGKELGSVLKGLGKIGAKALTKVIDSQVMSAVKHGNVIQLVSRNTGHSLQILQAANGHLVIDGMGGEGHQFYNSHFTVSQDEGGSFTLNNNFNYLAIKDGITQIFAAGTGGRGPVNCRFRIRESSLQSNFVVFESAAEKGRYLAVLPNGQMKSALATSSTDKDTHFAIRLIYSPHMQKS